MGVEPIDRARWVRNGELVADRDRALAGVTAEPQGLCFMNVRYDPRYQLPDYEETFPDP